MASRLEAEGFEIVARNVRVGHLELDLVARRGALLVVCEVRTRRRALPVHPIETFDLAKRARIRLAATRWLAASGLPRAELRFDAAGVVLEGAGGLVEVTYIEGAF